VIDQTPPTGSAWRDEGGTTLRGFLAVVRRWRWMVLIAALSAGVAGYFVASESDRTYESSAVLLVGPLNTADPDSLKASGQLAQTYAQIATGRPLLSITRQRLAAKGQQVKNLDKSIDASANAVTRLLTITATTTRAQLSADIANTHADVLIAEAKRGDTSAASPSGGTPGDETTTPAVPAVSGQLAVTERAQASGSPSGQSEIGVAILAAFGGLAGALGLALLLDRSGDAMTDPDELRAITGAGVLGTLSTAALAPTGTGRSGDRTRDDVAREFRVLAAKLNAIGERSLLIMVVDGEGAQVTRQLADALLAAGSRVAVVDAEHRALGRGRDSVPVDAPVGAGSEGTGGDSLFEDVADHRTPRIRVVTPSVEDEAGGADGARALLDELLTDCDVVLVSAPPLQRAPHALTWARVADGTVLVAQLDRTTRSDLAGAADNLRLVHARLLGTVVAAPAGMLRR
jgi:capsular polysaccharide biosynthesis protein